MSELDLILNQHTAGEQAIGFDYQFYIFMLLLLELKHGEKVGFEVKDDIHIDKSDGTTILFQAKHTVKTNIDGSTKNLTTSDSDLWKTLSNWTTLIKSDTQNLGFLDKHSFILTTNKNQNNNEFIDALCKFKSDNNIDAILSILKNLKKQTQDKFLKKCLRNIVSLGKKKLRVFLSKLALETSIDGVIKKIKEKILERVMQDKFVNPVYDSLYSNLQKAKYLEIKSRKKFEVSFTNFKNKFGKCFEVAFKDTKLPIRDFPILLPENLEDQIFIKQLIEIGEIQSGSKYIRTYTTQMLTFLRHFTYWSDQENFILLTDSDIFKRNSIQIWTNAFIKKYRNIKNKLNASIPLHDLETEIKELGIELVDYIREQDLTIPGFLPIGIEFSNGHYYALSNKLKIGWHYDWENKYKSE